MSLTSFDAVQLEESPLDILMGAVERLSGANDEMAVAAIVRVAARKLTGADGISVVLKKGDRVLFGKYSGTEVKIDGEEHLILREEDILGIVD